jgi:MFS family permease
MTPPRVANKGWLMGVLLVGPFMAQVDATIANVATPSIHTDLGASGAALELVIGGYLIAFAVLLITGARLGQTHGYRRILLIGVGVFCLASLLCGVAPSPVVLVLARVLQGVGAALIFPQTLTGIQLNFFGKERIRAIGLYAIALSSGAVAGQILGGVLISANIAGSHWRAIFLINPPIGAVVIAAALRYLPADGRPTARRVDGPGVAALSASLLLLVVPLALGRSEGWPAWTWISLAASVPMFMLFLATERRIAGNHGSPLINVQILARPPISWGLLTLLAATGTYYALLFTLAEYLQQGLADSPLVSGLTLIPWVAAFGVAGQLVRRLPPRMMPLAPGAGCMLLTASYLAISATLFTGHHGEAVLVPLLGVGGLGLGIQFSALLAHLTKSVPTEYASDISGVSTTAMQVGGAIGVAAFGTLYFSLNVSSGIHQATQAFAVTTAAFAAIALLATATAYRSTHQPTPSHRRSAKAKGALTTAGDAA